MKSKLQFILALIIFFHQVFILDMPVLKSASSASAEFKTLLKTTTIRLENNSITVLAPNSIFERHKPKNPPGERTISSAEVVSSVMEFFSPDNPSARRVFDIRTLFYLYFGIIPALFLMVLTWNSDARAQTRDTSPKDAVSTATDDTDTSRPKLFFDDVELNVKLENSETRGDPSFNVWMGLGGRLILLNPNGTDRSMEKRVLRYFKPSSLYLAAKSYETQGLYNVHQGYTGGTAEAENPFYKLSINGGYFRTHNHSPSQTEPISEIDPDRKSEESIEMEGSSLFNLSGNVGYPFVLNFREDGLLIARPRVTMNYAKLPNIDIATWDFGADAVTQLGPNQFSLAFNASLINNSFQGVGVIGEYEYVGKIHPQLTVRALFGPLSTVTVNPEMDLSWRFINVKAGYLYRSSADPFTDPLNQVSFDLSLTSSRSFLPSIFGNVTLNLKDRTDALTFMAGIEIQMGSFVNSGMTYRRSKRIDSLVYDRATDQEVAAANSASNSTLVQGLSRIRGGNQTVRLVMDKTNGQYYLTNDNSGIRIPINSNGNKNVDLEEILALAQRSNGLGVMAVEVITEGHKRIFYTYDGRAFLPKISSSDVSDPFSEASANLEKLKSTPEASFDIDQQIRKVEEIKKKMGPIANTLLQSLAAYPDSGPEEKKKKKALREIRRSYKDLEDHIDDLIVLMNRLNETIDTYLDVLSRSRAARLNPQAEVFMNERCRLNLLKDLIDRQLDKDKRDGKVILTKMKPDQLKDFILQVQTLIQGLNIPLESPVNFTPPAQTATSA
ncbi:MAG: hypothetical protein JW774_11520 [Candidatus Aureabacteria bacterium]|nr:hypothetical protein [Candidatus Auribacterota bacterium]